MPRDRSSRSLNILLRMESVILSSMHLALKPASNANHCYDSHTLVLNENEL